DGFGPARRLLLMPPGAPEQTVTAPDGLGRIAGRPTPSLAHELAERARRIALDHHREIVERRIGRALQHAMLVVGRVIACVPAAAGEIDAAVERHGVVDDHDLLVVRAADRVRVVVAELHATVWLPAEPVERPPLAVQAEQHRIVPDEDADLEPAFAP